MARACEASHPTVKAFLTWLDTSPHLQHLSWYSRFRAVIELWFAAATRNDPAYLERVKELSPDAIREGACDHFARMQMAMIEEPQDLLGEAYQAYSVRDTRNLAQYFTPDSVAKCIAEVQLADADEDLWRQPEGCRLLEPACGSGVLMLHTLEVIRKRLGQWALNRTQAVLCDIDPVCARMAALQMFWFPDRIGSVVVMQGDSLTQAQTCIAAFGRGLAPTYERIIRKPEVQA